MIGRLSAATAALTANRGGEGSTRSSIGGSISSLSKNMKNVNISSITKKMEEGLSNLNNIANLSGDNKKSKEAEERKHQLDTVIGLLDDVRLQCPQNHSGLILAYSGVTMAPISNPGIKFSWFRMSGSDQVTIVDESERAWYPPTVDDIGCILCAQCEDVFEQGLSRYVEVITCCRLAATCSSCMLLISENAFSVDLSKRIPY
jgi:hypothetical protein